MNIGVIPDGNRRYAKSEGIDKFKSYEKARDTIKKITGSLNGYSDQIESISFYIFSEENFNRPEEELETLFELLDENIEDMAEFFQDRDFSVNWASTAPEKLPDRLSDKLEDLEEKFNSGETTVNLLISYSGKEDILKSGQKVAEDGGKFTEENFSKNLEIQENIDFVIRTGDNPDRECLSGFPIWNSSYAEFYHIKKNFPAVTAEDVEEALEHYKKLRKKKGA